MKQRKTIQVSTISWKKLWKSQTYIIKITKEILHVLKLHKIQKKRIMCKMLIPYKIKTNKNNPQIGLLFPRNLIQRSYIRLVWPNQGFRMKVIGHKLITFLKFLSQTPKEMILIPFQEIDRLIHSIMKAYIWKMSKRLSLFWTIINFRVSNIFRTL